MQRTDSLEKILMMGKIEGKKRSGRLRMRWLDGIADAMDMNLSKLWKTVEDRGAWMLQSMELLTVGHDLATKNNKPQYLRELRKD